MKPLVYLAGPIAGTEAGVAVDWRFNAQYLLHDRGLEALSPMRAKETLSQSRIGNNFRDYEKRGVFFTSRGIMTRDFNDVRRCDALLVNLLGAKIVSAGTVMELAWAFAFQKPAVVAIEAEGNPHDGHPMIHEAIPFRVNSLEEAIDSVAIILGR